MQSMPNSRQEGESENRPQLSSWREGWTGKKGDFPASVCQDAQGAMGSFGLSPANTLQPGLSEPLLH